jgi:hypothetical protein
MGELVFCEAKSQPNRTLVLRSRLSFVSSYYLGLNVFHHRASSVFRGISAHHGVHRAPGNKKKKHQAEPSASSLLHQLDHWNLLKKKFDHWKNKAQNQSVLQRAGPRNINLRTQPIAPHLLSPTLQRQKNNYKYSWTTMTPNAT